MNSIIEAQEYDARNQARLEKIYLDERRKLGLDGGETYNTVTTYSTSSKKNSPFIQVSPKPAKYVKNQITLTDSQFKEFMDFIKEKMH